MKILVVEDDVTIRLLYEDIASVDNHKVILSFEDYKSCVSGCEASENRPDIAIVDYLLPDATGIEVARYLKKKYPGIRIIFITCFDNIEAEIKEVGAERLLVKPFDLQSLREVLLEQ